MKKFLSCGKAALVILIATLISLGFYTYMVARPISYGMNYHTETVYEGETFEGDVRFNTDNTQIIVNSSFNEGTEALYYYKSGYVFSVSALTDAAYAEEVKYINENFEDAVKAPFYACKINAFKMVAEGSDGYTTVYTCNSAVTFAIVYGILQLGLIALTVYALVISKKAKCCAE